MRNPLNQSFRVLTAILVATALLMMGKLPTLAHKADASLPTLKLDYQAGITGWNTTLDPANTAFTNDADTEMLMHAGLVRILPPAKTNGPSKVALDLAQSVKVSSDRKTYTFVIRKNARFSNGDQVTAQDVIFSITRAAGKDVDPQEAATYDPLIRGLVDYNSGKATNISGLKAVNSKTLQVRITKPAAYFLASFAYSSNYVLDPKVVRGHPIGYMTNACKADVGAGPFKPVCSTSGTDVTSFYPSGSTPTLTLVPNPYYYGHKPKIRLQLPVIPSNDTNYASYKAGSADVLTIIPTSYIPSWKGKKDYITWGQSLVLYVQLDFTRPPFNNLHCRLAVAHAIDRTTIVKKIIPGVYKELYTVVPPGFLGYYNGKATVNKKGGTPYYSEALAKKELAQCPGGIDVTWPYRVSTADARNTRRAIGDMLSKVGIKVTFKDLTSQEASLLQTTPMNKTGANIVRSGWQQDYPDPQDYVSLLLRDGSTYDIGGFNNKTFNKLVDRADVEFDSKKRAQLYEQAQKIAISQAAWVPLYNGLGNALVKSYVHGIVAGAAFADLMPSSGDWSKVSLSKH